MVQLIAYKRCNYLTPVEVLLALRQMAHWQFVPWQLVRYNWPPSQLVPFGYAPQGVRGLAPGKGIENIAPDNMGR